MTSPSTRFLAVWVSRGDRRRTSSLLFTGALVAAALASVALHLMIAIPQSHTRLDQISPVHHASAPAAFEWYAMDSTYRQRMVHTLLLNSSSSSPAPPGVDRWPSAGTAYVSPALAEAIATDPSLAGRVPGRIVGTIGDEGLTSPDALQVVAGVASGGTVFHPADAWGAEGTDDPQALPSAASRVMLFALVVTPWAMLITALGIAHADRLRSRCARLAMLGASTPQVQQFARGCTVRGVAAASLVGATVGALGVQVLARHGIWGLAFFAPSAVVTAAVGGLVVLVQLALTGAITATAVGRAVRRPYAQRRGPSPVPRAWVLAVGLLAATCLITLSVVRWATADKVSPGPAALLIFVVALPAAIIGVSVASGALVRRLVAAVPGTGSLGPAVALRQVAYETGPVVMQSLALVTLATVFALTSAVELIASEQDHGSGSGAWWTASIVDTTTDLAGVMDAIGPGAVVEQVQSSTAQVTATCALLSTAFGTLTTPDGGECQDSRTYEPGTLLAVPMTDDGTPFRTEDGRVAAGPVGMTGVPSTVHTVDPATTLPPPVNADVLYVTARLGDADTQQSAILAAAPITAFSMVQGDASTIVRVPRIRALSTTAAALGIGATVMALAVSASSGRAGRRAAHHLGRLGASSRTLRRLAMIRAVTTSSVSAVLAMVVSTIGAQSYLSLGSIYHPDATGTWTLAGLLVMSTVVAGLAAYLTAPTHEGLRHRAG